MRPHLIALAAIVVAGLAAAFGVRDAVALDLIFTLLLYAVLGQSWNWISGYAGNISFGHAIFFGARDSVVAARNHGILSRRRLRLFAFMLRNSVHAVDLFRIPTEKFVEIGRQLEI